VLAIFVLGDGCLETNRFDGGSAFGTWAEDGTGFARFQLGRVRLGEFHIHVASNVVFLLLVVGLVVAFGLTGGGAGGGGSVPPSEGFGVGGCECGGGWFGWFGLFFAKGVFGLGGGRRVEEC